ncbi:hypothetical protein BESB_075530 [Besnoitia besnoiti]|uniref:Uncharacterized protein n=1 Tax=Besnoitia besnoiti TaxID=94643 RepID=A0A2A9MDR1_BESBE|nr:uncharacterized protein BESB_075530 [Besnoitia besnoiti]PFH34401.1 hypothetical protein BESB_075530 [Besnoitia besnoiti]
MPVDLSEQDRHVPGHAAPVLAAQLDDSCNASADEESKSCGHSTDELSDSRLCRRNAGTSTQEVSGSFFLHVYCQPAYTEETETPLPLQDDSAGIASPPRRGSLETAETSAVDGEASSVCAASVANSAGVSVSGSAGGDIRSNTAEPTTDRALISQYAGYQGADITVQTTPQDEPLHNFSSTSPDSSFRIGGSCDIPRSRRSGSPGRGYVDRNERVSEACSEVSKEVDLAGPRPADATADEGEDEEIRDTKEALPLRTPPGGPVQGKSVADYGRDLVRELIDEFGKRRTNFAVLVPKVLALIRVFLHQSDTGCWGRPFAAPLPTCAAFNDTDQAKAVRLLEDFFPSFRSQGGLLLCTQGRRLESGGGGKYYFQDHKGRVIGCHKHDLAQYTAQGCVKSPVLLKTLLFCLVLKPVAFNGRHTAGRVCAGGTRQASSEGTTQPTGCSPSETASGCEAAKTVRGASGDPGSQACAAKQPLANFAKLDCHLTPLAESRERHISTCSEESLAKTEEEEARLWEAVADVRELVRQTDMLISCPSPAATGPASPGCRGVGVSTPKEAPASDVKKFLNNGDPVLFLDGRRSGDSGDYHPSRAPHTRTVRSSNPQRLVRVYRSLVQEERSHTVEHLLRVWSMSLHVHSPPEASNIKNARTQTGQVNAGCEVHCEQQLRQVTADELLAVHSDVAGVAVNDNFPRKKRRSSRQHADSKRLGPCGKLIDETVSRTGGLAESEEITEGMREGVPPEKGGRAASWRPCVSLLWVKPLPLEQSMLKWSRRSVVAETGSIDHGFENIRTDDMCPSVVAPAGRASYDEAAAKFSKAEMVDGPLPHRTASCASTRSPSDPSSADYTPSLLSPVSCVRGVSPGRSREEDSFQHSEDIRNIDAFLSDGPVSSWLARTIGAVPLLGTSSRRDDEGLPSKMDLVHEFRTSAPSRHSGTSEGAMRLWKERGRFGGSTALPPADAGLQAMLDAKCGRTTGAEQGFGIVGSNGGSASGSMRHEPHLSQRTRTPAAFERSSWLASESGRRSRGGGTQLENRSHGNGELVDQLEKIRMCQLQGMYSNLKSRFAHVGDVDIVKTVRTLIEAALGENMNWEAAINATPHVNSSDRHSGSTCETNAAISSYAPPKGHAPCESHRASRLRINQGERIRGGLLGIRPRESVVGELVVGERHSAFPVQGHGQRKRSSDGVLGQRKRNMGDPLDEVMKCGRMDCGSEVWKRRKSRSSRDPGSSAEFSESDVQSGMCNQKRSTLARRLNEDFELAADRVPRQHLETLFLRMIQATERLKVAGCEMNRSRES